MTVVSPSSLNTATFPDSAADNSILAAQMRLLINSLKGDFGNPQTSSYTFGATDFDCIVPMTNTAGMTATVPLNATTPFDQFAKLAVMQGGIGFVTWTPAAGVTILPPPNKSLTTNGPGAISVIWQVSINTWQAWDMGLASLLIAPPPQAIAAGYSLLVFDDEFTANSINYNGTYTPGAGSPTFPNWYTGSTTPLTAGQVFVSNNQLTITTDNSGFATGITTSKLQYNNPVANNSRPGNVVLNNTAGQTFTFGYFEVSAQYSQTGYLGSGTSWPACSMSSSFTTGVTIYPHIEVDIFEAEPSGGTGSNAFPSSTVHEWTSGSTRVDSGPNTTLITPAGFNYNQFNTYGCLWTPTQVCFYLNNQPVGVVSGSNPINANSAATFASFGNPIAGILAANTSGCNLSVGSGVNWTTLFDFVRVWQSN